jgi:hypothetical protein
VTAVVTIPTIGVFTPSTGLSVGEAAALVLVVTVAVGSTLTVATFGIAILLTGSHSRPVGVFLLIMAASMSIMVVTMIVRGHLAPDWLSIVVNGLVATSLVSIGTVLRTAGVPLETSDSTGDVTAG